MTATLTNCDPFGCHEWYESLPEQVFGQHQSPINLSVNDPFVTAPAEAETVKTPLVLNYDQYDVTKVVNCGHSVTFHAGGGNSYIAGGPLADTYKFLQFHFHWGLDDHVGSEHLLNGKQFSAELHFVHINTKYSSFEEALRHDDGLCVIGVFLQACEQKCNKDYKSVFNHISRVADKATDRFEEGIHMRLLIPEDTENYTFYHGSLTTHPYSECVIWINMLEPVTISKQQIGILRELKGHDGCGIGNNYRSIQSLFGRKIHHHLTACEPNCKAA